MCFHCILAGKHISAKSDIVESDIPLLLSKSAMKQAKLKLDSLNDIAEIFGNTVDLNNTSSGHYCLHLKETMTDIKECNICFDRTIMNQANIKSVKNCMHNLLIPTKQSLKS